jgi:hypothetical protein
MVEHLLQTLGYQLRNKRKDQQVPELPRWPGVALPPEKLRRIEIYRDAR